VCKDEADSSAPHPKQIFSKGRVADLRIPEDLEYAGALRALVKSGHDICIGIDLQSFYSEVPVELHNFVDSIFYRFMKENGTSMLVFYVTTHSGCSYKEVLFDGTIIKEWDDGAGLTSNREERDSQSGRRLYTLGVR